MTTLPAHISLFLILLSSSIWTRWNNLKIWTLTSPSFFQICDLQRHLVACCFSVLLCSCVWKAMHLDLELNTLPREIDCRVGQSETLHYVGQGPGAQVTALGQSKQHRYPLSEAAAGRWCTSGGLITPSSSNFVKTFLSVEANFKVTYRGRSC